MNEIRLKRVITKDYPFLYELLQKRDIMANISHKKMPSYSQHIKFVSSNPYSYWYIILIDHEKVGSIYLTKLNEVGISIMKEKQIKNLEMMVLKILMKKHPKKRYLANISARNKKQKGFFQSQGFKLIQYTYELTK
ncbi:MAG: N-acetyltransferase [Nitrosopumilaceae archaeon]